VTRKPELEMPFRAVLFDFDGTLADSFGAIAASTNYVRESYGLPPLPEAAVRRAVGYGINHLLSELVPGKPLAEAVARYREHHPTVLVSGTHLSPGVAETVAELHQRGYRLGVCSNKQVQYTKQLVEAFGLSAAMPLVLGPEDVNGRAKPDPAMLLEAMTRLAVKAEEAAYVGDMAIDVRTGRAAGVTTWLVAGGAAGEEPAAAAGPDRILSNFPELLTLL